MEICLFDFKEQEKLTILKVGFWCCLLDGFIDAFQFLDLSLQKNAINLILFSGFFVNLM